MPIHKRLFLLAGYDKNGIIDDALIHYASALSHFGDVILCMDSDCKKIELNKIKKYTIAIIAKRHGEYDFGSYKRSYEYARNKKILWDYDIVYMLNDSVFGPMFNIKNTLYALEQIPTDAAGIVVSQHKTHSFIESWFVRLNKKVFLSQWFDEFISSVTHQKNKTDITVKYEHGLSNLVKNNGCSWDGLYKIHGRYTYNRPKSLFKRGCPFIKRACFTRHNGDCGAQIKYILDHCDKKTVKSILKTANRIYGTEYMNHFLTYNPVKIFIRKVTYAFQKLRKNK